MLSTAESRKSAASWIKAVAADLEQDWVVKASEVFGIWGDSDPLYTLGQLRKALVGPGANTLSIIPGGRNMHVVERPWELADRVMEREEALPTT